MPEITLTRDPAHVRHGSNIGQPLTRRDGVLKVTGAARYAADNHPPGMLYAVHGGQQHRARPRRLARRRGRQGASRRGRGDDAGEPAAARRGSGRARPTPSCSGSTLLQNDRVRYANQPIAVVIAETLEAATEGAALLAPRYEAEPARVGLDAGESFVPPAVGVGNPAEVAARRRRGRRSPRPRTRIEATYETPAQYHNAMEPHAIVAAWDGDRLSIDTPSQGLAMAQGRIAGLFGIPPENIHIRSPFLGGGFGSQGADLGAAGARHPGGQAGRPAGQAGAAPRADVRPGRPSRADAADAAPRRRRATAQLTAHRPSRQDRDLEHLRRFLRAGRRRLAHALCQPGDRHLARGGAARHRHAAVHARARRGDGHRSRWKARSTRWR